MILPVVFLCLTAVLPPSTGEEPEGFDALSTSKASQQKLIVDRHNTLRRGVKPTASNMLKMEWCPPAAKNAQAWANQCTLSHSPGNMRRTTVQCGENLFMASAPFAWSDVIDAWYNEKEDFKYGTGAKTQGAVIGHYTQMVWYNSYQIGCAVAFCPNSKYEYFYVCQYCPMGNLLSSIPTPYKEGEPCGDCPNACDNGLCNGFPDFTCVSTCSAASACWTETTPCPSTFFENAEVFKSEHLTVKKEETHLTDVTKTPDDISPVRGREESASTAELCPPGAGLRYRPDVITGNAVLLLQEIPSTVRISAFNATVLSSKGKRMKELGWPIYM